MSMTTNFAKGIEGTQIILSEIMPFNSITQNESFDQQFCLQLLLVRPSQDGGLYIFFFFLFSNNQPSFF